MLNSYGLTTQTFHRYHFMTHTGYVRTPIDLRIPDDEATHGGRRPSSPQITLTSSNLMVRWYELRLVANIRCG
jgi:hypothetical protein